MSKVWDTWMFANGSLASVFNDCLERDGQVFATQAKEDSLRGMIVGMKHRNPMQRLDTVACLRTLERMLTLDDQGDGVERKEGEGPAKRNMKPIAVKRPFVPGGLTR
jgi:hypothetical protein